MVTSRVCLRMLRSLLTRWDEASGVERLDPFVTRRPQRPNDDAVIADSVGLALLVVDILAPGQPLQ